MIRVGGACFLDNGVPPVHDVMPGAAVPVVVSGEVEDARAGHVKSDVVVIRQLVEKVAGVSGFVSASAIVRAGHVRADADSEVGPAFPHRVSILADGDKRRFAGVDEPLRCDGGEEERRRHKKQKIERIEPVPDFHL